MENNFNESMNLSGIVNNNVIPPVFDEVTMGGNTNYTISMNNDNSLGVSQNMHYEVMPNISVSNQFNSVSSENTNSVVIGSSNTSGLAISQNMNYETNSLSNEVSAINNNANVNTNNVVANNDTINNTDASANANAQTIKEIPIFDKFIVGTEQLRQLINNAKKVAVNNPSIPQSQVLGIRLDENGIKISASNSDINYEYTDRSVKYTKTLDIHIDVEKFSKFVANVEFDTIELQLDTEYNILNALLPQGAKYVFPQRIDPSTSQPIDLNFTFPINYDDMTAIDYNAMVEVINASKAIRTAQNLEIACKGLYFSNLVQASDRTTIYMQENQSILKTQNFFIDNNFCDLIANVKFDPNKFRIGFTTDANNDIRAITLSDTSLNICGHVQPNFVMPAEVVSRYWNANPAIKVAINTKKLLNVLNRISSAQDETRDDVIHIAIEGNTLTLRSNGGASSDLISIVNTGNIKSEFLLPFSKITRLIGGIKSENLYLVEDKDTPECICIEADNYKLIVGKMMVM